MTKNKYSEQLSKINLLRYKELIYFLVHREIRVRFQNSIFGFFWTLLEPLGLMLIYSVVFSFILRFNIEDYSLFLLTGLIPWMFLSRSILKGMNALIKNRALIKKVYFPRQIFPLVVVLAELINFLPAYLLVLAYGIFLKAEFAWSQLLWIPVALVIQTIFVFSLVMLLSVLNVFFRDIEFMANLFIRGWMYLSPIIYPIVKVPEKYLDLYMLNPMATIISMYRGVFSQYESANAFYIGIISLMSIALLIISWKLFERLNRKVGEVI